MHEVMQNYLDVFYSKSKAAANRLDLEELFQEYYIEEYQKQYKSNDKSHFSDAVEMREFFNDGVEILKEFKKRIGGFFSKRGTYLVGCEVPLDLPPIKTLSTVHYTGYLDVVLYHERTDRFTIIDIKTSTRGWNDKTKKDTMKKYQLVLYKKYFSEQYNIPIDKIDVKFLILKRKIYENTEYIMRRMTEFTPASGRNTVNAASRTMNNFIEEVFNQDGSIKDNKYPKSVSKWNCTFCPYAEDSNLCGQGVHFS
jgi:CRISPR/Cas system-associated exonuclease Cas4 (RecB family)